MKLVTKIEVRISRELMCCRRPGDYRDHQADICNPRVVVAGLVRYVAYWGMAPLHSARVRLLYIFLSLCVSEFRDSAARQLSVCRLREYNTVLNRPGKMLSMCTGVKKKTLPVIDSQKWKSSILTGPRVGHNWEVHRTVLLNTFL